MDTINQTYKQYTDEDGETYYCPVMFMDGNKVKSEWAAINCVETNIVGRYAGNLDIVN